MTTAPDSPQLRTVLALRRLGSALTAANRAVGGAVGIKDTDLAVLDVLHQEGPLTPRRPSPPTAPTSSSSNVKSSIVLMMPNSRSTRSPTTG